MSDYLILDNLILAGIAFFALLVIGIIFSRLYRRSSKERSFVRTGLGGQKVVMDGGAIVFPVFHETILVNMNTLKLEVTRFGKDSLFTKDRMRVDVVVAFFVGSAAARGDRRIHAVSAGKIAGLGSHAVKIRLARQ